MNKVVSWKRTTAITRVGLLAWVCSGLGTAGATAGRIPYRPAHDGHVLERSLAGDRPGGGRPRRDGSGVRSTGAPVPSAQDPAAICAQVRSWIEAARVTADPRYLGRSLALLERCWSAGDKAVGIEPRVLRATLRQSLHDFDGALEDIAQALQREPTHAGAWLTKATIHTVRAEFPAARQSVIQLLRTADARTASVAAAQVASVSGDPAVAIRRLQDVLVSPKEDGPAWGVRERVWASTVLAETLARAGNPTEAEAWFRRGLAWAPGDPYLLGALADVLLDRGRPEEVLTLLSGKERVDGLLLRLAEAATRLGDSRGAGWCGELARRFGEARRRQDAVHLREEARFELRLRTNAAVALHLARDNWKVQREPADARILWEAARGAGDRGAETEVIAWKRSTGLRDVSWPDGLDDQAGGR